MEGNVFVGELSVEPNHSTVKDLVIEALSRVNVPSNIKLKNKALDETELIVDFDKISNVFTKIIDNAVEAIGDSGSIRIWSTKEDRAINVFVSDSGSGIPRSILPKIFSPLVTSKAKGMGMSLATCKRILEAHGGKISFETEEGKGTTFVVMLPIKTDVAPDDSVKLHSGEATFTDLPIVTPFHK